MTTDVTESARDVAADWLEGWAAAVERQDAPAAAAMFTEDGYWRDLLAFTWDLRTFHGKVRMAAALREFSGAGGAGGFRLEEGQEAVFTERNGVACLEAFFIFETSAARARGHLRLVRDEANPTNWQAWTLLTASQELKGFEERTGHRRPRGNEHSRGRENWLDRRSRASRFEDSDPDVVVIGAGQAGLSLAARLGVLGVSTLVIDREERVGDNWRNRYHSLARVSGLWPVWSLGEVAASQPLLVLTCRFGCVGVGQRTVAGV